MKLGDVVQTKSGYGLILDAFDAEGITRYQVFTSSSTVFTFYEDEVVPVGRIDEIEDILDKIKNFKDTLKATA